MNRTYTLPRTALFFLGLSLIFLAFFLLSTLNKLTSLQNISGSVATFSRAGVLNSLDQIALSGNAMSFVGAPVLLRDVPVASVLGNYVFIVGEEDEVQLPVVLLGEITQRQEESAVEVKERDTVRVTGTLFELKDLSALIDPGYVTPEQYRYLSQFNFFILAQRVVGQN